MTIYITADLHLFHSKVISRCNRPIDIDNHNDWIIKQMNKLVTPQDTVYHIGDFALTKNIDNINKVCNRLNGNWIHVLGNHDNEKLLSSAFIGTRHKIVSPLYNLIYNGLTIVLCHFPIESWNKKHYNSLHLFGHLHTRENFYNLTPIKNRYLVSFDSHPNHLPYRLDDLIDHRY